LGKQLAKVTSLEVGKKLTMYGTSLKVDYVDKINKLLEIVQINKFKKIVEIGQFGLKQGDGVGISKQDLIALNRIVKLGSAAADGKLGQIKEMTELKMMRDVDKGGKLKAFDELGDVGESLKLGGLILLNEIDAEWATQRRKEAVQMYTDFFNKGRDKFEKTEWPEEKSTPFNTKKWYRGIKPELRLAPVIILVFRKFLYQSHLIQILNCRKVFKFSNPEKAFSRIFNKITAGDTVGKKKKLINTLISLKKITNTDSLRVQMESIGGPAGFKKMYIESTSGQNSLTKRYSRYLISKKILY